MKENVIKYLVIFFIIIAFIGAFSMRLLGGNLPANISETISECSFSLHGSVIMDGLTDHEIDTTPEQYLSQTTLVALIKVSETFQIGSGQGWMYKAEIIEVLSNAEDANDVPEEIFVYQPNLFQSLAIFDYDNMNITMQWSELMLWENSKYIIFAERVANSVPYTEYEDSRTFALKSYDHILRFHVIPVLIDDQNVITLDVRTLKINAKLILIEGSGGGLTYDLTRKYTYDEITKYNFVSNGETAEEIYEHWCEMMIDVLY